MRFANAVDIVPETVLLETLGIIKTYLKDRLDIQFCELLVPIRLDQELALKSVWHSGGEEWVQKIKDGYGNYNGQISYAYDKRKSLWIVPKSSRELLNSETYYDLLASTVLIDIPKYVHLTPHSIKTSVIQLVYHDGQLIGVINFESTQYLKATKILKDEIASIVEAIALLYGLRKTYTIQSTSTKLALDTLREFKNLPLTISPKIFIASPAKSDKAVTAKITRTLSLYDIEVYYWKSDTDPGNIPEQIWREVSTSDIGICYFSEISRTSGHAYQDNYNVVFEAGMMHALSKSANDTMQGWIAIREVDSPGVPFDFVTERILSVPRNPEGKVDEEAFAVELERILDSIPIPRRELL